ncbi:MAG: zf-HC2 domain-containing protein [Desulfobacterales bacterium]
MFNLNCRDVSRLVSDSMDRSLPLSTRIKMRIHLGMCKYCARYAKQLHFLRKICAENVEIPSEASLSDAAIERIRDAVRAFHEK